MAIIRYQGQHIPTYSGAERTHIRSNKHPLWEFIIRQIRPKHGKILDLRQTMQVRSDGIITYKWAIKSAPDHFPQLFKNSLMFPDIIISARVLINIVSFEAAVR